MNVGKLIILDDKIAARSSNQCSPVVFCWVRFLMALLLCTSKRLCNKLHDSDCFEPYPNNMKPLIPAQKWAAKITLTNCGVGLSPGDRQVAEALPV